MPIETNLPRLSWLRGFLSRRVLLILTGSLVCAYAIAVLFYVQSVPDLGLKSVFSTEIRSAPVPGAYRGKKPEAGDKVVKIADEEIDSWPALLNAPFRLREKLADHPSANFPWLKRERVDDEERDWVQVQFARDGHPDFTTELALGTLPLEELIPSIL